MDSSWGPPSFPAFVQSGIFRVSPPSSVNLLENSLKDRPRVRLLDATNSSHIADEENFHTYPYIKIYLSVYHRSNCVLSNVYAEVPTQLLRM